MHKLLGMNFKALLLEVRTVVVLPAPSRIHSNTKGLYMELLIQ